MADRRFDSSRASKASRAESRDPTLTVAPASANGRALARKVLETEAAAILALVDRLDARFDAAVLILRQCEGRVILTGMGKSGIICQKIAATLTSTGTPAFFLHPAEAIHGDLGVIQGDDVVVALSYSGETDEVLLLLETIRRLGARLIAITGAPASALAQAADVALDCSVAEEACPMNLVPTASTTAALAIGDALAMTLLVEKGFRQEDFASLHPGGKLGKRLMRVEALMHGGPHCPIVGSDTKMRDVIYEMSSKGLGMTCVVAAGGGDKAALLGIITDGDLRRHMERGTEILGLVAGDVMTRSPVTVSRATLAAEALNIMEQRKITSVVVVDEGVAAGLTDGVTRVAGVVHVHDLWRMEMF
jgi:arabinose-5-phosphate isomerase